MSHTTTRIGTRKYIIAAIGVVAAMLAYVFGKWLIHQVEQAFTPHPQYARFVHQLEHATPGDLVLWNSGYMRKIGGGYTVAGNLRMWRCGYQENLDITHAPTLAAIDKIVPQTSPEFKMYRAEYITQCTFSRY